MARKIGMAAIFVVFAATLLQATYAATYTVGDSTGWRIPPNGNSQFYDNWVENKNFRVGDILVFNFTTGQHDVARVTTETAYDACNTRDTNFTENNGPARIPLNATGDHYFICAVPGHCAAGQKIKIEVEAGTGTAPTPGSSPSTPGSPPNTPGSPPNTPSSASSLVATLSVLLMSIALVFFC